MPKYNCSKCNRTFDYTEKDLQPLSGVEMAICAKEGLDIGSTAKLVCPFCDTAVLLQGAGRPKQTSTRTLSMAGRDYPIYTSLQDVGVSAARGNRCGYETTFKAIPSNHNENSACCQR